MILGRIECLPSFANEIELDLHLFSFVVDPEDLSSQNSRYTL